MDVLEKLGLSKAEIKVYLTLWELGSVASGRVVHETNLRKSTVYESIKRLTEKGLVSYVIKNGRKQFEAAHPDRILDYVDDKRRELDVLKSEAKDAVTLLEKGFDTVKPHAESKVLVGIEGFKTMRRDILKHAVRRGGGKSTKGKKSELLLIGAISRESDVITGFFEEWNKKRQKRGIHLRILHKESAREKKMTSKKYMGSMFDTRFLPSSVESPAVINVYGDRVVNVLWKGTYPICFMLINKEIADSYRKYFEYLWDASVS